MRFAGMSSLEFSVGWKLNELEFISQVESDVSPFASECQPKPTCSTQNKAKRANEIVFLILPGAPGFAGVRIFGVGCPICRAAR
jgi:hypothetical protein